MGRVFLLSILDLYNPCYIPLKTWSHTHYECLTTTMDLIATMDVMVQ